MWSLTRLSSSSPSRASPLRDRALVIGALGLLAALAWAWLLAMPAMDGAAVRGEPLMPDLRAWSPADAFAMFAMWAIMMIGMMVPSAVPMVLLYARVAAKGRHLSRAHGRTALFTAGYIAIWTLFSGLATAAQWGLEAMALLTPAMRTASTAVGGALLFAAGAYQFTPAKQACLEHCRSPFVFVTRHWRTGPLGALVMGLHHGAYCLGCCWLLMFLLFVVGVMNLLWVAIIAAFVLVEKAMPGGAVVARVSGAGLMVAGAFMATGIM